MPSSRIRRAPPNLGDLYEVLKYSVLFFQRPKYMCCLLLLFPVFFRRKILKKGVIRDRPRRHHDLYPARQDDA